MTVNYQTPKTRFWAYVWIPRYQCAPWGQWSSFTKDLGQPQLGPVSVCLTNMIGKGRLMHTKMFLELPWSTGWGLCFGTAKIVYCRSIKSFLLNQLILLQFNENQDVHKITNIRLIMVFRVWIDIYFLWSCEIQKHFPHLSVSHFVLK